MKKLIVASAQQQMRLFDSLESYRKELNRFLYMARAKGARLVVFPGLTGVMAATPMVEGFRVNLLKQADERHRKRRSLWTRTRGAIAGGTATLLGANFRKAFIQLLETDPASLLMAYETTFAELARAYDVTIVAGSAYLPDSAGVIRHRATVFGPDGTVLGRHNKLALSAEDEGLAVAGDAWTVVTTPVGRLGILLGEEALYPEAGRVLAYQGADLLVTLAAADNEALAAYVRHGTIAQAQENRSFALTSFLVGRNYLAPDDEQNGVFVGKSGIYAPLEMTPRYTGVLVEMGTASSEGLLTAELDRERLHALWQGGVEPVRSHMPVELFAKYLPALYSSRRTLADAWPDSERVERAPTLPSAFFAAPPERPAPVRPPEPPAQPAPAEPSEPAAEQPSELAPAGEPSESLAPVAPPEPLDLPEPVAEDE
jgi:predicted amidohydrolase